MTDETTLYSEFRVIVPQGTSIRDMAVALQETCLNHTIEGITEYNPDTAHRPDFEKWLGDRDTGWVPYFKFKDEVGGYQHNALNDLWECWRASRREFE